MTSPVLIANPSSNDRTVLVTYIGRADSLSKALSITSVEIPPGSYFEAYVLKGYGSISVHEHRPYVRPLGLDPMHQPIEPAPPAPIQP